jgi:hypothetical protein
MNRYKITFSTLFGYTDDREETFATDDQAIGYATAYAKGRRAQVYDQAGRQIHETGRLPGRITPVEKIWPWPSSSKSRANGDSADGLENEVDKRFAFGRTQFFLNAKCSYRLPRPEAKRQGRERNK